MATGIWSEKNNYIEELYRDASWKYKQPKCPDCNTGLEIKKEIVDGKRYTYLECNKCKLIKKV